MGKTKRILFITHKTSGAPARYRVQALSSGISDLGINVAVTHPELPDLLEELNNSSHVILFRLWATEHLIESLAVAQANNPDLIVGFDVDDPLWVKFDVQTDEEKRNTEAMQTLMRGCDFMLGSTRELALRGGQFADMPGFHTPNSVHPQSLQASQRARRLPRIPGGGQRIAFQSGSGTHSEHWEVAEKAVLHYLENNPKSSLFMFGIAPWTENLDKFRKQVVQIPLMDWLDLPYWINQMDLVVSPVGGVEWGANTKSAIKWLEAALVRTPTVASSTEPFRAAITDGVTGFLCDKDGWDGAIERALNTKSLRKVRKAAYQQAVTECSAKNSAKILLDGLKDIVPLRRFRDLEGTYGEIKLADGRLSLHPAREKERLPRSLQAKLFLQSYK